MVFPVMARGALAGVEERRAVGEWCERSSRERHAMGESLAGVAGRGCRFVGGGVSMGIRCESFFYLSRGSFGGGGTVVGGLRHMIFG